MQVKYYLCVARHAQASSELYCVQWIGYSVDKGVLSLATLSPCARRSALLLITSVMQLHHYVAHRFLFLAVVRSEVCV